MKGKKTKNLMKKKKTEGKPTWRDGLAVLVHVGAAGLGEDDVIAEVAHLHLHEVEHLLLALIILDLVHLLGQASQHGAAAGLLDGHRGAGVRALGRNRVVASLAQAVVQPAGRMQSSEIQLTISLVQMPCTPTMRVCHVASAT